MLLLGISASALLLALIITLLHLIRTRTIYHFLFVERWAFLLLLLFIAAGESFIFISGKNRISRTSIEDPLARWLMSLGYCLIMLIAAIVFYFIMSLVGFFVLPLFHPDVFGP